MSVPKERLAPADSLQPRAEVRGSIRVLVRGLPERLAEQVFQRVAGNCTRGRAPLKGTPAKIELCLAIAKSVRIRLAATKI